MQSAPSRLTTSLSDSTAIATLSMHNEAAIAAISLRSFKNSTANAPWPAAGTQKSISSRCPTSELRPRRSSPAHARSRASNSPRRSFSSRVPTFPRTGTMSKSRFCLTSCAARRPLDDPTRLPLGNARMLSAPTNASRTSALSPAATTPNNSSRFAGTSFMLWTAKSTCCSSKPRSSSWVKRPFPPKS